ncbi:argininosuccinate lyase [Alcaligenes nematophilus]|uniref:Argininosuccinate lyase n=4 Tax=Alcaligenes TaxID=507 RepID=A0A2U2BPL4_ALCFA|nr:MULTISPECIES: argininosuccinate lyase [Alcaligenes]ASC89006.1 argininosuccinate lyase [Alcaligenes faecalis]KVX07440.1 argininosuccinate lyase [Alcaligenes faecalis]MCX5470321.1 argininosuccinate lyase [Alcaligenes nematophilus]MCX5564840.1 argininosuccinate lyase [Alcaligenes phenolicus]MDT8470635.1 argininosuccinate lyase [Alcaligenes nematophilus]
MSSNTPSSSQDQFANKAMAWSARFSEPVSDLVKRYTASVDFDKRMARFDIQGSLAHASMLAAVGVITEQDKADIERGMSQILDEIAQGQFQWLLDLEDVHLNIEKRLVELIGDAGKRLHTGRSRNDQVATDIRLWLRNEIDIALDLLAQMQRKLAELALAQADTILPGFTHLQVAQPVTFGHHLLAYAEMFQRDAERLQDCRKRVNRLPLGAAALAGTSYPIDREMVAKLLDFDDVCRNSLDAVSDRDFAIEFCAAAALIMTHISRFSEELVLWMSPRVGFIDLADRFCTGSSIMPQKKNPDVPELARGKTGRVNGHLIALLTLMKGQPLAYNKDNQEDKEGLFDSADTIRDTLTIFVDLISGIKVKPEAMRAAALQGFATATDLADYLVKKGLPFRDAHETVALAVRECEQLGCDLADLNLEQLQKFDSRIESDIFGVLTLEGSVASRKHIGGTAPERVRIEAQRILDRIPG